MSELVFPGQGDADVKLNVADTGNSDNGRSSEKVVEFVGDGAKDVAHSFDTITKVIPVEHTDDVKFVG